jgi:hypothetical protein
VLVSCLQPGRWHIQRGVVGGRWHIQRGVVGGRSPRHVTFSGRKVMPQLAVSSCMKVGSGTVARCHFPLRAEIQPLDWLFMH